MNYSAIAETDIGISKSTNQDSVLIKHATCNGEEILLAVICDGMGGLSKGELASATVIRKVNDWFENELPFELKSVDMNIIGAKLSLVLKRLNAKIRNYSQNNGAKMGTTFTGILFIENDYVIVHVGDTRVYHINKTVTQLTEDQTFVAREISRGTMTVQQAKTDRRRNMLLQCVGASDTVEPQVVTGKTEKGAYMICSDGFRHEITENEMYNLLKPKNLVSKDIMHNNIRILINSVKERQEKDNISAVLIKVE